MTSKVIEGNFLKFCEKVSWFSKQSNIAWPYDNFGLSSYGHLLSMIFFLNKTSNGKILQKSIIIIYEIEYTIYITSYTKKIKGNNNLCIHLKTHWPTNSFSRQSRCHFFVYIFYIIKMEESLYVFILFYWTLQNEYKNNCERLDFIPLSHLTSEIQNIYGLEAKPLIKLSSLGENKV